eukprot:1869244-Amphidinium_carterae.2
MAISRPLMTCWDHGVGGKRCNQRQLVGVMWFGRPDIKGGPSRQSEGRLKLFLLSRVAESAGTTSASNSLAREAAGKDNLERASRSLIYGACLRCIDITVRLQLQS